MIMLVRGYSGEKEVKRPWGTALPGVDVDEMLIQVLEQQVERQLCDASLRS